MNRFAFVLFALSLLVAGCKDVDIDPQPPTPQAEISIEINGEFCAVNGSFAGGQLRTRATSRTSAHTRPNSAPPATTSRHAKKTSIAK